MKIKACLFDLDGVLVDTARFHYLAWKSMADRLGFAFTEMDNERLKGVSRMDSLHILLEIGNLKLTEQEELRIAEEKNKLYLEHVKSMAPADVLPGVRDFLTSLKAGGILTGLGSVSKNAGIILDRTNLTCLFDAIVDGMMVTNAKPHPEVFLVGARMLKTDPSACLVFEDSVAGIQAAHRAGMKCIGVGSRETLKHADKVISGFKSLIMSDVLL